MTACNVTLLTGSINLAVEVALVLIGIAVGSSLQAEKSKSTCPVPVQPWQVAPTPEQSRKDFRLPQYVFPWHYDLRLLINVGDGDKFDFDGQVNISVSDPSARTLQVCAIAGFIEGATQDTSSILLSYLTLLPCFLKFQQAVTNLKK